MTNVTPHDDVTDLETANDTDLLPEIEVATLNSGDYFGEFALLKEDKDRFKIDQSEISIRIAFLKYF